ncbi:MAG: hypothetical protein LQ340_005949 [Diploschistes diacapsis]|nr:MAG: hypothetical protein LQ340_005949 [Diploschistes diacapsis]
MHRTRSSAGFSLDIPLIMLTASILKIFYWPGARFDRALLVQALVMLVVQSILLKVALDNRPTPLRPQGIEMKSMSGARSPMLTPREASFETQSTSWRPYNFWRWRDQQAYWNFLLTLTLGLSALHILLRPSPESAGLYTTLLGAAGLGIEAVLPIPQMLTNYSSQSCRGFRLSVLANWLFGDAMKMGFFFWSSPGKIPWAFKACGVFQACCDLGLGAQYWMYGEGLGEEAFAHLA